MIKLGTLTLDRYNEKYKFLIDEFNNDSKSKFIHGVNNRLVNSSSLGNFSYKSAYVVLDNNTPVGYLYISTNVNDEVYLEVSVLKNMRRKGYGKKILAEVSDYLFINHNIRIVKADIDPSNINSINTAEACDFILDEEDYENRNYTGKMVFYKESTCYINKRRK